ncbi:unnamed protein product [Malus baccata var. baccata]
MRVKSGIYLIACGVVASPPPPPHTPSNTVSPALSIQSSDNPIGLYPPAPTTSCLTTTAISTTTTATTSTGNCNNGNSVFASIFAPSSALALITQPPGPQQTSLLSSFSNQISALGRPDGSTKISSVNEPTSLLNGCCGIERLTASWVGVVHDTTSSPSQQSSTTLQWNKEPESGGAAHVGAELGLELLSTANAAELTDLMMGPPSSGGADAPPCSSVASPLFGGQPMTRDLLGLSIGSGGGDLSSFGGSGGAFNVATAYGSGGGGGGISQRETWEGAQDRKPDRSSLLYTELHSVFCADYIIYM